MTERTKTVGQIAYEAYCSHTDWKSRVSGQTLPQWAATSPLIQGAWEAAGNAVRDARTADLVAREIRRASDEAAQARHISRLADAYLPDPPDTAEKDTP